MGDWVFIDINFLRESGVIQAEETTQFIAHEGRMTEVRPIEYKPLSGVSGNSCERQRLKAVKQLYERKVMPFIDTYQIIQAPAPRGWSALGYDRL